MSLIERVARSNGVVGSSSVGSCGSHCLDKVHCTKISAHAVLGRHEYIASRVCWKFTVTDMSQDCGWTDGWVTNGVKSHTGQRSQKSVTPDGSTTYASSTKPSSSIIRQAAAVMPCNQRTTTYQQKTMHQHRPNKHTKQQRTHARTHAPFCKCPRESFPIPVRGLRECVRACVRCHPPAHRTRIRTHVRTGKYVWTAATTPLGTRTGTTSKLLH